MSKYTTELRYICESLAGLKKSVGYSEVNSVIATARPLIFDFDYPLYQGVDKVRLESSIILAYYDREIGFETVGLFKLKLMAKMRQIMPYFNQLYKSADLAYNPLENVSYKETVNRENVGGKTNSSESSGTSNDSSNGTRKYSDTPSGGLTGVMSDEYLTEAEMTSTTVTGRTTDTTSGSMQERYLAEDVKVITGKLGGESFAKMILEYRETILNIDSMIIGELADLFMGVW